MPLIRYTYPADVAVHGSEPFEAPAVVAQVLVVERRRAELVTEAPEAIDLDAACLDCPAADCADCPLR